MADDIGSLFGERPFTWLLNRIMGRPKIPELPSGAVQPGGPSISPPVPKSLHDWPAIMARPISPNIEYRRSQILWPSSYLEEMFKRWPKEWGPVPRNPEGSAGPRLMSDQPPGDIVWDWSQIDPGTVTLWNRDRGTKQPNLQSTPTPTEQPPESAAPSSMLGRVLQDYGRIESQLGSDAKPMDIMKARQQEVGISPEDARRAWRFAKKIMRDPEATTYDRVTAFSDMLENGLAYVNQNGDLFSAFSSGPRTNAEFLLTSKEWFRIWNLIESGVSPEDIARDHGRDISKYFHTIRPPQQ